MPPKQLVEFFEKHLDKIYWKSLCLNTNIPVEFFEKHLDKVYWIYLCYNENLPVRFFEENLDKINWINLCYNTNMPINFFEKHLDKVNWSSLCKNNFNCYLHNREIQINKMKMSLVLKEIESFIYTVLRNVLSCLQKGGLGYIEVVSKYNDF